MSDDRSDDPGFLARWSKRKRDARAAESRQAEPPVAPEPAPPAPPAPAAESPAPTETPKLPPIESLTHESDFTPFLRQGVPPALRNAALRRLWSDPVIRDAIGPARDYAWDWNVPGGAPGSGAPPTEEEVRAVLAQLRGAAPPVPAAETPSPAPETAPKPAAAASSETAGNCLIPQQFPAPASAPEPAPEPTTPTTAKRRHGSATPT